MAIKVRTINLWCKEVAHETGMLAQVLEPLARSGANVQLVMGYEIPGHSSRAAIELYPVSGAKVTNAATAAGMSTSDIPCLLVDGDDRRGLGAELAAAVAAAGVNISFLMAQVLGRKFSAAIGFANEADADTAAKAIKAVGRRRSAGSARRRRG